MVRWFCVGSCACFNGWGRRRRSDTFSYTPPSVPSPSKGAGLKPAPGRREQRATIHDWPGAVDDRLRDDFISQVTRNAYGLQQDLLDFLSGRSAVEDAAEVSDRPYVVGDPLIKVCS